MVVEKHEGITGEELPRKSDGPKLWEFLPLKNLWAMVSAGELVDECFTPSWGSMCNNPCEYNYHIDGRKIERYTVSTGSMEMYYISIKE